MKRASGDPLLAFNTWTYQYKIHLYPDNADIFSDLGRLQQAQKAEIDEYFPTATLPAERANADKVWGGCPHGAPEFFAWHRIYLFFFEEIVRKVANAPSFTLPYWGYSTPAQRTIPREFRATLLNTPTGREDNPLYNPRNHLLNDLDAPEALLARNVDDPTPANRYWSQTTFEDFRTAAERVPHNRVHVAVGANAYDGYDMLRVAQSPRDPIFWLHHCEIDRIWYSWNKAGGAKPDPGAAWLNESFYFIDGNGALASKKGKDVLETTQLDYVYDEAIPKPAPLAGEAPVPALAAVALAEAADVKLVGRSTTVKLAGRGAQELTAAKTAEGRYFLEMTGARANRPLSTNLDVYLNLPPGVSAQDREKFLVGVIGLFGGFHGHHQHSEDYRFEVTEAVRRLAKAGRWTGSPEVTVLVSAGDTPAGMSFARVALKEARR